MPAARHLAHAGCNFHALTNGSTCLPRAVPCCTVLRHAARIDDLRESGLGGSPQALQARQWDGVESEEQVGSPHICYFNRSGWFGGMPGTAQGFSLSSSLLTTHAHTAPLPAGAPRPQAVLLDQHDRAARLLAALCGQGGAPRKQTTLRQPIYASLPGCNMNLRHGRRAASVVQQTKQTALVPAHPHTSLPSPGLERQARLLPGPAGGCADSRGH